MMKYVLFICMAAGCSHAFSQSYMNNWYFGDYSGLNFSSGEPVYQFSPIRSYEADASVSDSFGNLLFYTNGVTIWDRDNNVMPHGDSLNIAEQLSLPYGEGSGITQGVIILPMPGSEDKYYVFYIKRADDFYDVYTLMYSVVDMALNSGNGDVVEGNKNIHFDPSGNYLWEKMTAVKHANGKDWWLITISGKTVEDEPSYFEKFLITEDGVSAPTFQTYDYWTIYEDDGWSGWMIRGQMKFSLSGNKLAVTRTSHLDIYEFNRCDGMLTNRLIIDSLPISSYGLEFSPDETKLYVGSIGNNALKPHLTQICLDCNVITKTTLYSDNKKYEFAQMQIAPDGKIYTALAEVNFQEDDARYLSVINYPDSFGTACDFELASFMLGDSGRIRYGLPNFVNYDLPALETPCDTTDTTDITEQIIDNNEFYIYPNPANTFITLSSQVNYSNITVEIYNAAGVKVKEIKIVTSTQKINIENFANGVYFFTVKQNEEIIFRESFVKE